MSDAPDAFEAWIKPMYLAAEAALVLAVDKIRKAGHDLGAYVLVVADTTHKASWLVARDLGRVDDGGDAPGWMSVVPKAEVSRVLRTCKCEDFAEMVDGPLDDGKMRLMFTADGKVHCFDIDAFPPLGPTGDA